MSSARWYLRALGRNPLVRLSDRLESLAVLAVFVLALLAVPVAMQAGHLAYDARMQTAVEQAHSRHSVESVVLEGSRGLPADFDSPAYVRVQWREGTRLRTEQVASAATVETGAPLTIWLDQSGKVVSAPLTATDAELGAVAAAVSVWATALVGSVLASVVVRRGLDRARARAWEHELHVLAHNDDGWANRHI
ncbi:Rv1733c family protein [Mycolicibacterium mengxianglii]|uniref:Rv1733c family protein n=1 Tax=Mycolicibacterium mengxianglii TaxID=2736649 RepID=UPI0018D159C8|nr:hypothetical protein [Mycolicibacterium mengxianglii]